jgi:hypothetical protein
MRRTLAAVALTASLVTTAPPGLFDRLWVLLSPLWDAAPSLPAHLPQTKAGCGMDAFGGCNGATEPQTDAGCGAGPFGSCDPGS